VSSSSKAKPPVDKCRVIKVDGDAILVSGGAAMNAEDRLLFAEVVQAATDRFYTDRAARDKAADK